MGSAEPSSIFPVNYKVKVIIRVGKLLLEPGAFWSNIMDYCIEPSGWALKQWLQAEESGFSRKLLCTAPRPIINLSQQNPDGV